MPSDFRGEMNKKILFIQPFALDNDSLTHLPLIWFIYSENYLKSKINSLLTDLLYLPVEKKKGRIDLNTLKEGEKFYSQMDALLSEINFEIDENTYICISITTSHYYLPSHLIAEYFKKRFPKVIIICGGAHASACPNNFNYKNSPIDFLVVGEGESSLYNIIKNSYKKPKHTKIIIGNPLSNLNDLSPLEFSLMDKYIADFNELCISLSRGCSFNCSFCMEYILSKFANCSKRWRVYTPKRAIEETNRMINYAEIHNIKSLGFYDPTFGANRSWLNTFLNLYEPHDEINGTWVETRADILNEKLIDILYKKKFFQMYGVESFSPEILLIMNKTKNPENYIKKFEKIFEIHKEKDYKFIANVLFNHPGEKKSTFEESYNGLRKISKKDNQNIALFNIRYYHHFPGTSVYNNIDQYERTYGTHIYFPNWWNNEELLLNGPYMVKPSYSLSLIESIILYSKVSRELSDINIINLKSSKSKNFMVQLVSIKNAIGIIDKLKERLLNFITEYKIDDVKTFSENEGKTNF